MSPSLPHYKGDIIIEPATTPPPTTHYYRPQPWHSADNKQQYWEQLTGQVSEKQNIGALGKQIDEKQQKQHFESWETFWGRPGNGAPRDSSQKENLMKMLHYPETSDKVTDFSSGVSFSVQTQCPG